MKNMKSEISNQKLRKALLLKDIEVHKGYTLRAF